MLLLRNSISNTKKFLQRTIDTFKSFISKGNNMYERLPKPKTPPCHHPLLCGPNPTDHNVDVGIESGCKELDNFYSEFTHRWDSNKAKNKGQNRAKTQKNEVGLTVASQKMTLSETQGFCTGDRAEKRRGFLRTRAKTQNQKTGLPEDSAEKRGGFLKNRVKTQKNEAGLTVTSQKMTLSETEESCTEDHAEKKGGFLTNRVNTQNQKMALSEDRAEKQGGFPKNQAKTQKNEQVLTDTSQKTTLSEPDHPEKRRGFLKNRAKTQNQKMALSETQESCSEDRAEKRGGFPKNSQKTENISTDTSQKTTLSDSAQKMNRRQSWSSDVCSRSVRERRLCLVAEKLKKLEIINEEEDQGSSSVDVEEILHHYSRLTCPAYLDIVDKFFTEMCAEFLGSKLA